MGRLIDADALTIDYYDEYETKDDAYAYAYVSKAQIESAPSIDIVRCKECKWFNHFEDKEHGEWNTCERHMIFMNADDFCSYGERREQ